MNPQTAKEVSVLEQLIFVGFNSRVAAIDRDTGQTVWQWKCPKGIGYVACLLDGDRLIASVNGYTYCLNPATGAQIWFNELPGMGTGVPSVSSLRGTSMNSVGMAAAEEVQQSSEAASHSSHTG